MPKPAIPLAATLAEITAALTKLRRRPDNRQSGARINASWSLRLTRGNAVSFYLELTLERAGAPTTSKSIPIAIADCETRGASAWFNERTYRLSPSTVQKQADGILASIGATVAHHTEKAAKAAAIVVEPEPASCAAAGGNAAVRMNQCAACPWKVDTNLDDIPAYQRAKHRSLRSSIRPGTSGMGADGLRIMACHESPEGREQACAGWLANQLGPGNNIALRLAVSFGRFGDIRNLRLDGEQLETFEETLREDDGDYYDEDA